MITGVTRRAIEELFRTFDPDPLGMNALMSSRPSIPVGIHWWGDMDEIEFLERLYDLDSLPSKGARFDSARDDIRQHRYNNDDLPNEYIFTDDRFKLRTSDKALLKFLAETLHPEVRTDRNEVGLIRSRLNELLRHDHYELQQVDVISGVPVFGAVPIAARTITSHMLQTAIAEAIWLKGPSAPNLPAFCDSLGFPSSGTEIDPMSNKRLYVMDRLNKVERSELVTIARNVKQDCPDDSLIDLINEIDIKSTVGKRGRPKNIIFAANGPKPEIVISDTVDNEIKITKNEQYCLTYDTEIDPNQGLTWDDLLVWWQTKEEIISTDAANSSLYKRLMLACGDNEAEQLVLYSYGTILKEKSFSIPALVPQVYLHFDPLTYRQRNGPSPLARQRMDFLMLLPNSHRVVIEVDGIEHYSTGARNADPRRYADMMREDRRLRLDGYEVYRFGGAEFINKTSANIVMRKFFNDLFERYDIK